MTGILGQGPRGLFIVTGEGEHWSWTSKISNRSCLASMSSLRAYSPATIVSQSIGSVRPDTSVARYVETPRSADNHNVVPLRRFARS